MIRAYQNAKQFRKPINLKEERKTKIIKPSESVAGKYYGAFKVEKWPEDIDGFIVEAKQKWHSNQVNRR